MIRHDKARRGLARINEVLHNLIRVKTSGVIPFPRRGKQKTRVRPILIAAMCLTSVERTSTTKIGTVAMWHLSPFSLSGYCFPRFALTFQKCWEVNLRLQCPPMFSAFLDAIKL